MARKRGQPPKPPDEKKSIQKNVMFTEGQIADVEAAKEIESPEKKTAAYIRDVSVEHAQQIINKSRKK